MPPRFPPPDPHETTWLEPADAPPILAPTAVFADGTASPEAERVADRVLDARPGLLIVLSRPGP